MLEEEKKVSVLAVVRAIFFRRAYCGVFVGKHFQKRVWSTGMVLHISKESGLELVPVSTFPSSIRMKVASLSRPHVRFPSSISFE